MKRAATHCESGASSSSRRHSYTKVLVNRKHPIRGLWRRNGNLVAGITVEDDGGRKAIKWVPVKAETAAEAQVEFRTLLVERAENRLPHIGPCPKFGDCLEQTHLPRLALSGKKPDTHTTETGHLTKWRESPGHVYPVEGATTLRFAVVRRDRL